MEENNNKQLCDDLAAEEDAERMERHEEESAETEFLADSVKSLSPMQLVLKRFFRSKLSIIGLAMIIFLLLFCWVGPFFSPYGEGTVDTETDRVNITVTSIEVTVENEFGETETFVVYRVQESPKTVDDRALPSWEHWIGTDKNGYDVFSRLMYGGRISLTLGFVVVILETLLGVLLGGLAGYFGKWVDMLIMRIVDIFNCIPTLPIMLIISYMLDANSVGDMPKLYIMMAMLTLIGWAGVARMVRGQILYLREQEYMMAAECTGLSLWRKLFKHLLPNVLPQLIVSMTLGLGGIILTDATLGFLGLGVPQDFATWGNMINVLTSEVSYWGQYPNQWIPVGICIVLAVLAFNFVGDGLRDAFDPKMKR